MDHALAFLDERGVATVRLDATPLGQPLYEQLGFVTQFVLARYDGVLPTTDRPPNPEVVTVPPEQWAELVALDRFVTGTDRERFLVRLFEEQPGEVRGVAGPNGWLGLSTARTGARAVMLGPCLGEAGGLLLADACRRHAGRRVYIDIPEGNAPAARLAAGHGLTVQRHLTRMCRGEPVCERVELLWASSGPEKG
jgi:hypothetical protein